MSSELDRVRSARPTLVPSDEVRRAARQRLLAAIADEPAELYANRHRDTARSSRRAIRPRSFGVGLALVCSVAVVAAVVGAVIAFGHHGIRSPAAGSDHAARGAILASGGQMLGGGVAHRDVEIVRHKLPHNPAGTAAAITAVVDRLAALLGEGRARHCPVNGQQLNPVACKLSSPGQGTVIVARDVPPAVQRKIKAEADAGRLPGVVTFTTGMAAGPASAIVQTIVGQASKQGHKLVDQTGLEAQYNAALSDGNRLKTTLNLPLERIARQSLAHSIALNHAAGGAFVAMDPDTGAIDAIGSLPGARSNRSAFPAGRDGAVEAAGPTGAVFAPITALAALQGGAWKPNMTFDDTGRHCAGPAGSRQCRQNSGGAADGVIDMVNALRVQSLDFLYNLGARTNANLPGHPQGGALQDWAAQLGIGHQTGIDLPGETSGTLPTPARRRHLNQLEHQCDTATGPFQGKSRHEPGGCGIADGNDRPWSVGDNESLAAGQGDLQVSPIQLAVAYAAIANGNTVVQPHVGAQITTGSGAVLQTIEPTPTRHLSLNSGNLAVVRDGMLRQTSTSGGTSGDVFGDFRPKVYGQVGSTLTQPVHSKTPESSGWFAGYVPASATSKPIVVIVWVPGGGFGDVSAAPVARQILSQWFTGHPGPYRPGASTAG
jgi:cell division protein FtsI/penicillin-binding protein 2